MSKLKGHIYLIGFMGSGKSALSRRLGRLYDAQVVEMDAEIEGKCGMSINHIFEKCGEERFRDEESGLLCKIEKMPPAVVSCGGGIVLRPENVERMKRSGTVIWLDASAETIYNRVRMSKNRPLLKDNMNIDYIARMMEKRREKYENACDCRMDTDKKSIGEVLGEISALIGEG